jgi:hypothetical protein
VGLPAALAPVTQELCIFGFGAEFFKPWQFTVRVRVKVRASCVKVRSGEGSGDSGEG